MKNSLQKTIGFLYRNFFKKFIFLIDAEKIHDMIIVWGKFLAGHPITRKMTSAVFGYENKILEQEIMGIRFKNPVGLAAGFDKNAELTQLMGPVGFGFEEVGSITGESCAGNPKPRLWRLIKSKAIIVWYGLKNDGAEIISKRLAGLKSDIPVGISVAKTNSPVTVDPIAGAADYLKAFKIFAEAGIGDYFTVNISCPNAFGGEPFTDPQELSMLLSELDEVETDKPVFVKLPPDLSDKQTDAILEICENHRVHGFVISNLTKKPELLDIDKKEFAKINPGKGGISGKAIEELSNKLIEHVYRKTRGVRTSDGKDFIIIGVGGIFSAKDAYKKIRRGASLVQLITGMIFEGPQLIGQINYGLAELLKKDKFKNISEAIGADVK